MGPWEPLIVAPAADAIGRTSRAEMGMSAAIFDAAEEQSRAVARYGSAGIENRVDRIKPIGDGKNRGLFVTKKQLGIAIAQ